MKKIILLFLLFPFISYGKNVSDFISKDNYDRLYPFMNENMKEKLNPSKTIRRRVISRLNTNNQARVSVNNIVMNNNIPKRNIVSRSVRNTNQNNNFVIEKNEIVQRTLSDCMAGYSRCMNNYCERKDTDYNKCYCSSKLSQIDSKYKPEIENLIIQIIKLKQNIKFNKDEFNTYWNENITKHTGNNIWDKLEESLNINWIDTENRMRGNQAYKIASEYCMKELDNCYYASYSMENSYLSEISRDCSVYEKRLEKLKRTAESLIQKHTR